MRIEDEHQRDLPSVYLFLSTAEARELRDALNQLLGTPFQRRHEHVSNAAYDREVTVQIDEDSA